eukprot:5453322-Amphidinium_carterae.1
MKISDALRNNACRDYAETTRGANIMTWLSAGPGRHGILHVFRLVEVIKGEASTTQSAALNDPTHPLFVPSAPMLETTSLGVFEPTRPAETIESTTTMACTQMVTAAQSRREDRAVKCSCNSSFSSLQLSEAASLAHTMLFRHPQACSAAADCQQMPD